MSVQIIDFPIHLTRGILAARKKKLFVHTNIHAKKDMLGTNFGSLYYGSINSPFMVWKLYLDELCRIVFNISDRFIFPLLTSGINGNCRSATACTTSNCSQLKINKNKTIFFRALVLFCISLS